MNITNPNVMCASPDPNLAKSSPGTLAQALGTSVYNFRPPPNFNSVGFGLPSPSLNLSVSPAPVSPVPTRADYIYPSFGAPSVQINTMSIDTRVNAINNPPAPYHSYKPLGAKHAPLHDDPQNLEDQHKRKYEPIPVVPPLARVSSSFSKCSICVKYMNKNDDSIVITSTECYHPVHKECFRLHCLESMKRSQKVLCKLCDAEV